MTASAARPESRTVAKRRDFLRCACGAVLGEWLPDRFVPVPGYVVAISTSRRRDPDLAGVVTCPACFAERRVERR